ncbi:MAG: hypothetical protein OHK0039_46290 [Bacteroidia bacterium]
MAAIFFLPACEDLGNFDRDILPVSDHVDTRYTDTIEIEFETRLLDSVTNYRADLQLFGNYIDPQFGRITAETYTQVLPRSNLNFGSAQDLIFDSLVLKLNIESTYGRLATTQTLRVYELQDTFPDADAISSRTRLAYDTSNDFGNGYQINLEASSGVAIVRVRLDDALGRRLLFADPAILAERDKFQDFFKGLYIGTDPVDFLSREPGAIFSLIGSSSNTQLELYYKLREGSSQAYRPQVEPFQIASSTPRFTRLTRTELSDKLLATELTQPDTTARYEFMQGGLLIKNFIRFKGIEDLGSIAVASAELILPVDTSILGSSDRLRPPANIVPVFAGEDGQEVTTSGGDLVAATSLIPYNSTQGYYSISLTNYVQQIANGQRLNYGLVLLPENYVYRINRVAFGGNGHPSLAPKLKLIYTTLPR